MHRQLISNLANNAVNPRIIQKCVNHSSLNHKMRYIEVTDEQMMAAVEGIWWWLLAVKQPCLFVAWISEMMAVFTAVNTVIMNAV